MDSLTQIVLGAAVGEVAAGRKIGNRAMLWGAVAGTIPDLDVIIGSLFMNDINGLAFHRAITHSIFFAIVFSFFISYYTHWLYSNGYHKLKWYKQLSTFVSIAFTTLIAGVLIFVTYTLGGLVGLVTSSIICIWAVYAIGSQMLKGYVVDDQESINIGYWSWYKLFFWAIFTHPLLDCFTVYGTQLFAPFTNYRVALNNISVADPLYTFPFLVCVIIASRMARSYHEESQNNIDKDFRLSNDAYKGRQFVNAFGITLSCIYIGWTFYNKSKINHVMEETLTELKIDYSRFMTCPTILNNVLWSATAETDSSFYTGLYSFYDKEPRFKLFEVPKNHNLISPKPDDKVINTLKWFSNDYYSVMRRKDGHIQINDMRYGTFRGEATDENSYIFKFIVEKDKSGIYQLKNAGGRPKAGSEKDIFRDLTNRIKGQ